MKISKKLFIAPIMGLLGLALTQPVSAETFCTKTTKTVTTTTSSSAPYTVRQIVESPVTVEEAASCTDAPLTSFDRVIEKPVVIKESPVMVERPVVVESPVVVQRDTLMAQPVVIKKHGHHLLHVGVSPLGRVDLF